jgi:transposase
MEHYVGLDVSLKLTAICIVDRTGKIEREGVVASDPETIAAFIKSHAPHVARVGLETGATSTWLWTELNKLGLPVICIDARHAKAALKLQINKSDRNDAVGIARIMQCGWYKEVRVKDLDSHAIKALLVSRALLVKVKRDIENQVRGLLKNLGLVIGQAKMNVFARARRGAGRGSARTRWRSRAAAQGTRGYRAADCGPRPQGHAPSAQRCSSSTVYDSTWRRSNYGSLLSCDDR